MTRIIYFQHANDDDLDIASFSSSVRGSVSLPQDMQDYNQIMRDEVLQSVKSTNYRTRRGPKPKVSDSIIFIYLFTYITVFRSASRFLETVDVPGARTKHLRRFPSGND